MNVVTTALLLHDSLQFIEGRQAADDEQDAFLLLSAASGLTRQLTQRKLQHNPTILLSPTAA